MQARLLTCINAGDVVQGIFEAMDQLALPQTDGSRRDARALDGLLSSLPLFRQVARPRIAPIASVSRSRVVRRGAVLCRRGERLPGVIAVGYGILKLALRSPDGEEKVVRFLNANETFGECVALLDRTCPVELVALEESMVVEIPAVPLLRLIDSDPRFAKNLVRAMAERFLGLLAEHEASLQQSALQRLAAYLGSLAEPNGTPDTWVARLPTSKTAVAARLGITKETMSRLLRELANRGLIAVARREIEIRDLPLLAQVAR